MPHNLAFALQETVDREAANLHRISERDAGVKPAPKVWSKKEELGHLIDSAANNHIRFVRASFEPEFRGPGYQQDAWVRTHGYQEMPWAEILDFWQRYNHFLAGAGEADSGRPPDDAVRGRQQRNRDAAVSHRRLHAAHAASPGPHSAEGKNYAVSRGSGRGLALAERHRGVHASRAARRKIAGQQRDSEEERRNCAKRQRVGGADAIQKRGQQSGQRQRRAYTDRDSATCQRDALPQDHPQYVVSLGAQRQPD